MRPTDVSTPARLAHLTKDGRGYPILATVSRSHSGVDFGALSELRKLALATFNWCGVWTAVRRRGAMAGRDDSAR
jgi:hypothetical protein